eukprot:scaffold55219_cov26-Tisochrysis_lutea.AAC.2
MVIGGIPCASSRRATGGTGGSGRWIVGTACSARTSPDGIVTTRPALSPSPLFPPCSPAPLLYSTPHGGPRLGAPPLSVSSVDLLLLLSLVSRVLLLLCYSRDFAELMVGERQSLIV